MTFAQVIPPGRGVDRPLPTPVHSVPEPNTLGVLLVAVVVLLKRRCR